MISNVVYSLPDVVRRLSLLIFAGCIAFTGISQRKDVLLENDWYSIATDSSYGYEKLLQKPVSSNRNGL